MGNDASGRAVSRILVALDSFRGSEAVLELAVTLAARQRAELEALFIEDLDLVHTASLPFVQEVDLVSASIRPFAEYDLARALRKETEQVQRQLRHMAQRSHIAFRMRVARGRLLETALAAVDADMLLVARPAGGVAGWAFARQGTKRHPPGGASRQRVCVLHDGSDAARRALALADLIAEEQGTQVAVVAIMSEEAGPMGGPGEPSASSPRHARELFRATPEAPVPSGLSCSLLLLPSKIGMHIARGWVTRLRCPVLFVS